MHVVDGGLVNRGEKKGTVSLGVQAALPAQAAQGAAKTLADRTDGALTIHGDGLGHTPSGLAVTTVKLLEGFRVPSSRLAY
jgi:hypothetical protein